MPSAAVVAAAYRIRRASSAALRSACSLRRRGLAGAAQLTDLLAAGRISQARGAQVLTGIGGEPGREPAWRMQLGYRLGACSLGYLHGGAVQTVQTLPRTDPAIALDGAVLVTQPDTGTWWTAAQRRRADAGQGQRLRREDPVAADRPGCTRPRPAETPVSW